MGIFEEDPGKPWGPITPPSNFEPQPPPEWANRLPDYGGGGAEGESGSGGGTAPPGMNFTFNITPPKTPTPTVRAPRYMLDTPSLSGIYRGLVGNGPFMGWGLPDTGYEKYVRDFFEKGGEFKDEEDARKLRRAYITNKNPGQITGTIIEPRPWYPRNPGGGGGGYPIGPPRPGPTPPGPFKITEPQLGRFRGRGQYMTFDEMDLGSLPEGVRTYVDRLMRMLGYVPTGVYGAYGAKEYFKSGSGTGQNVDQIIGSLSTDPNAQGWLKWFAYRKGLTPTTSPFPVIAPAG